MALSAETVGTIVAALIGALAALLGLVISKENKTSEFREKWIDALRSEIASLIGHLCGIEGTARRQPDVDAAWTEAREDIVSLNRYIALIRLRLNPKEKQSRTIEGLLVEIATMFAGRPINTQAFDDLERRILAESRALLKYEWRRVRKGERFFRGLKLSLLIVVLAAGGSLGYYGLYPLVASKSAARPVGDSATSRIVGKPPRVTAPPSPR
jgi:hypothetical protein